MPGLTYEEARRIFRYDPDTGKLFWTRDARNGEIAAGTEAGHNTPSKVGYYRRIGVGVKLYYTHRIVFLIHNGRWPEGVIDHINHNGLDNRIENLREVSIGENNMNLSERKLSERGVFGVGWHKKAGKWRAYIRDEHLGLFDRFDDAVSARISAEKRAGFHFNHGKNTKEIA